MMKAYISLILLFFTVCVFAQNSLNVEFIPEKGVFGADYHIYQNDSLIYTNCSTKNNIKTLYNLKKGEYLIKYNTIFGIDSLTVKFNENEEWKSVTLETEKIDSLKLNKTYSEIESLKDFEKITIEYNLRGCFISKNNNITLTKEKGKYYRIINNQKRRISLKKVQNIIEYEKTLRNLKIEENIDGTLTMVTCSEFISFKKNNEQIFSKNIFCGDWSKSSEIVKWIK